MFPDSQAAKTDKPGKGDKVDRPRSERPQLSPEAMALQQMMRGIHF
jgi:hypothetical protein